MHHHERRHFLKRIVKKYSKFLVDTTTQLDIALKKYKVKCKAGCFECCTSGFFDITLLDALHLNESIKNMPPRVRNKIIANANDQLDILETKGAFSRKNPLLKNLASIDSIARRSAKMSCPALDVDGACLIYQHRPHICRLFGPTVRGPRRIVRLEGCGYFKREIPDLDFDILRNYESEDRLLKAMFTKAGRRRIRDVDTIIPAAIVLDMKKWL
jgi:Fe-S-cluster containining protein